jgi:serine palmitoyltransferase
MDGNYIKVRGISKKIINFGSMDFLGFSRCKEVKDVSIQALEKYGCGSCGPRGFYGTIDTHLDFEDNLAKFMGTEESIAYSDSASAVSSTIPAFAKKGDLLIIDDACNESIMQGCNLSRSTLLYFKHNDMADLELLLKNVVADDKKFKRKSSDQRRFIVTEGLFSNTGGICPLPEILKLKEIYCYRLMLDESLSFGTMGVTGRGVTEHFGIPITDIEIINVAMDTVLASVGGLCIGTREVVDHQRLSGAGYCFSAAAPPFLSSAASVALKLMQENPKTIEKLRSNSVYLYEKLKTIKGLKHVSTCASPIMHLNFDSEPISKADDEYKIIQLARLCLENGVGVVSSKYIIVQHLKNLRPSIKLCVSSCHTHKEMDTAIAGIKLAMTQISS